MSAATSQDAKQSSESTINEESETEKKLKIENENLSKEIQLITEKKVEFEVSSTSKSRRCKGLCLVVYIETANMPVLARDQLMLDENCHQLNVNSFKNEKYE